MRVKTPARARPPSARMKSRARTRAGSDGAWPASRKAKYASIVVERFPGPPA